MTKTLNNILFFKKLSRLDGFDKAIIVRWIISVAILVTRAVYVSRAGAESGRHDEMKGGVGCLYMQTIGPIGDVRPTRPYN